MTTLILGVIGVVIAIVASIVKDLIPAPWHYRKALIALTIIAGGTLAIVSTVLQHVATDKANNATTQANNKMKSILTQIKGFGITQNEDTGELQAAGQANTLAPGKYSVVIAAGPSVADLRRYAAKLRDQFPGIDGDEICIAKSPDRAAVKTKYRLFFGRHLNFMTAALFHTLATNSGFPPPGGRPRVVDDDKNKCEP